MMLPIIKVCNDISPNSQPLSIAARIFTARFVLPTLPAYKEAAAAESTSNHWPDASQRDGEPANSRITWHLARNHDPRGSH